MFVFRFLEGVPGSSCGFFVFPLLSLEGEEGKKRDIVVWCDIAVSSQLSQASSYGP
jgi:hypothetical protein